MELQNSKEILHNALVGNYGVGAFNFVNIEMLKAILSSAEENKSPVIIQCSTGAIKYAGAKVLADIAKDYVKDMTVPVCLNLDHGKTFEDCKNAIDAGFTNVMIDASSLPKEENIALTKGALFTGKVNENLNSSDESYALISGEKTILPLYSPSI